MVIFVVIAFNTSHKNNNKTCSQAKIMALSKIERGKLTNG